MSMMKKLFLVLFPIVTFSQNKELFKKADLFYNKSKNDSAVFYYKKGFESCQNCSEELLAGHYLKFGRANRLIENRSVALSSYLKAQNIYQKLNDQNGLFNTKIYLAEFYRFLDEIDTAYGLIEEAGQMVQFEGIEKRVLAYYYNRRASIIEHKFDDKEKVIELSKKSIALAKEAGAYKLMLYSYNEIGFAYQYQGKNDEARKYYFKAYDIAKEFNLGVEMCDVLYLIGDEVGLRAMDKKGKVNRELNKKARKYFLEGLELATKINFLFKQRDFADRLFYNYLEVDEITEAHKYKDLLHTYTTAINDYIRQKQIAEMEAKYEVEKKDNEIRLRESEIRFQKFLLIFLFVLLGVIFLFFIKSTKDKKRFQYQNQKIAEILSQRTILLKEIHHRIKNNLQLTSSFLFLQSNKHNDPKLSEIINESQKHINSVALVHEMLYQEESLSLINISKYFKELGNRLLEFTPNKAIQFKLQVADISLPLGYATSLGLILNELITNTLKYAFNEGGGIITLSMDMRKEGCYEFRYSDNGVGLSKEPEAYLKETLGLKLIKMSAEEIDADLEIINKDGLTYKMFFETKNELILDL